MKKSHPTRTPRAVTRPFDHASARRYAELVAQVITGEHLRLTKERARPLLEATVRAMTDQEVINAMDALVRTACAHATAADALGNALFDKLALDMWNGVQAYVAAYARGKSGVQRGVRRLSTKKARR